MEVLLGRLNNCLDLNITLEFLEEELRSISENDEEYNEILKQSLDITESNYKHLDNIFIKNLKLPKNKKDFLEIVDEVSILNNFIPKKSKLRIINIDINNFIDFENESIYNINEIFKISKKYKADIVCFQNCVNFDYNKIYNCKKNNSELNIKVQDYIGVINSLFPYLVFMPNLIKSKRIDSYTSSGLLTSSKYKPYFEEKIKIADDSGILYFIINLDGNSVCIINVYLKTYSSEFICKIDNISFLVDSVILLGYIENKKYLQDLRNSFFINILYDCKFLGIDEENYNYLFLRNMDCKYNTNLYYTKHLPHFPIIFDVIKILN